MCIVSMILMWHALLLVFLLSARILTPNSKKIEIPQICDSEEIYSALCLGVQDYFKKSGFKKAVIGLSGGIDSALTAAIAVNALGKENVIGVSMPSSFSSDHSKLDAKELANNLGIQFENIPIHNIVEGIQ